MLSPQLRSKVHQLWTMFWSAGMTNPLVAIEQITYLLFLRQLEKLDHDRVRAGKASIYTPRPNAEGVQTDYSVCKWSHLRRHVTFELLNSTVFPWLRTLEKWLAEQPGNGSIDLREITGRLDDAYFALDPNKTSTLTSAVASIDDLFRALDTRSANADIMGDIFEHLLGEIQSSGKNGQFRTPRHIIRFMVELLDPAPGSRILDPACGTGGFLFNTLVHWRRKATAANSVVVEWDGTPHRCHGGDATIEDLITDDCFHGYDNDRTMIRVAWMNLILHGIEFPRITQRDSLSKRLADAESGTYDYILANPPFAGNVDKDDISPLATRFPRGKSGKPLTTDTELLFVWLILDLLKPGGRAAVIVPDGVLFGSTNAHHHLRRDLLFAHTLEAVVSLPGGVFYPYAGVKTSILVFQKAGEEKKPGDDPRTREVWFYEIADEAFSLDQKRKARLTGPNDLWDALVKFRNRDTSARYFQPRYEKQRWRQVDDEFVKLFPEHASQKGALLGLQELWPQCPGNPEMADAEAISKFSGKLDQLLQRAVHNAFGEMGSTKVLKARDLELARAEFDKQHRSTWTRLQRESREYLDRDFEQHGLHALKVGFEAAVERARARFETAITAGSHVGVEGVDDTALIKSLLTAFAQLDGFEVWLRSAEIHELPQKDDTQPQLSWIVPVRRWARSDDWGEPPEGEPRVEKPTHDKAGIVRADYLTWLRDTLEAFDDDATVLDEYRERLEPASIEAAALNLSAGRHKPVALTTARHRSPGEVIRELQEVHAIIQERLTNLLAMVEGHDAPPAPVTRTTTAKASTAATASTRKANRKPIRTPRVAKHKPKRKPTRAVKKTARRRASPPRTAAKPAAKRVVKKPVRTARRVARKKPRK
jgi:type I restriction enzyme M protein